MTTVVRVRNVNEAFEELKRNAQFPTKWRNISPRGMPTIEWRNGPFVTDYTIPTERVLFDRFRDCNPFFHFFEALWILDGRDDVEFLAQFNPRMADYSDDGKKFHAPYGYRMRYHFEQRNNKAMALDQLKTAIQLLRNDPTSRQVVLGIWDPTWDLGMKSKDIPCNDMVMFKVREGRLNMTVHCRSNDAIWGAYGANVVQFSTLQEFVARALGLECGVYSQVSDSFHIYTSNEAWARVKDKAAQPDPYESIVRPYPLMSEHTPYDAWLTQLNAFLRDAPMSKFDVDPYFNNVAGPMMGAWRVYKDNKDTKNKRIDRAIQLLDEYCAAEDWSMACVQWLERRREAK